MLTLKSMIDSIEEGDDGAKNMQSPFAGDTATRIPELADGEGETNFKPEVSLSMPWPHVAYNVLRTQGLVRHRLRGFGIGALWALLRHTLLTFYPWQIFVSTPNDGNGGYLYDARVALIEQALVGPGRAFEGIEVKRRGYEKKNPDTDKAHGKVLIQYTNDQMNDMYERVVCPQTAIYRLWFEDEKMSDHEWPAVGDQIAPGDGNQKRQQGSCEDIPDDVEEESDDESEDEDDDEDDGLICSVTGIFC